MGRAAAPAPEEPPIDLSLNHYMEERALAIAMEKAVIPGEREKIERLMALRVALARHRDAYINEATERRHARGEVYSKARVAAINEMAPSRDELDANVKALYSVQPDAEGVLKAHARTHFAHALVTRRLMLAGLTPDIAEAARRMQEHEERFAKAWVAAVGDPGFAAELREEQRKAVLSLRTATRPVYLASDPPFEMDDDDARELGKSWSRLDALAGALGVKPLSHFIAFPDEGEGAPAQELLAVVVALISAIETPGRKFPAKRRTVSVLAKIRAGLAEAAQRGGNARFEVDI